MKSVSQFVDLAISGDKIVRKPSSFPPAMMAFAGIMVTLAAIGVFGVAHGATQAGVILRMVPGAADSPDRSPSAVRFFRHGAASARRPDTGLRDLRVQVDAEVPEPGVHDQRRHARARAEPLRDAQRRHDVRARRDPGEDPLLARQPPRHPPRVLGRDLDDLVDDGSHSGGMKPRPVPSILCAPVAPPDSTADSAGSTATTRTFALRSLSTFVAPWSECAVPTMCTNASTPATPIAARSPRRARGNHRPRRGYSADRTTSAPAAR